MTMNFLMCSERSGSNLITKMLDAHSDVCGPATKHLINPVARNLYRYEPITAKANWQCLLNDIDQLLRSPFSVWRCQFTLDDLHNAAAPGDIVALLKFVFMREAHSHNKTHVFIKENHLYELMTFLLLNFPAAKYLYQVRDPRDMALSWKKHAGHPGGVVAAARQWQKDQQNYLKNFSELKKRGQAMLLRYEDLISAPETELQKVMAFFQLAFEPQMLQFHQNDLTLQNAAQQPAWENLGRGILSDNKQKYRRGLSEHEIIAVEKICASEMQFFAYQPESSAAQRHACTEAHIVELARTEAATISHKRPAGAQANADAKKQFYQHEAGSSAINWMRSDDINS
jgi:hypothetical protein